MAISLILIIELFPIIWPSLFLINKAPPPILWIAPLSRLTPIILLAYVPPNKFRVLDAMPSRIFKLLLRLFKLLVVPPLAFITFASRKATILFGSDAISSGSKPSLLISELFYVWNCCNFKIKLFLYCLNDYACLLLNLAIPFLNLWLFQPLPPTFSFILLGYSPIESPPPRSLSESWLAPLTACVNEVSMRYCPPGPLICIGIIALVRFDGSKQQKI